MIDRIFSYLDVVSLCRCAQVSKAWNVLALDGSNWQRIDLFDFQRDVEVNKERDDRPTCLKDESLMHLKQKNKEKDGLAINAGLGGRLCVGTSNRKYLEALRRIPQAALAQGMPEHRQQLDAHFSPVVS